MTQDIKDLMVILMKSTGNYTQARIHNKVEKFAYIEGMRMCIDAIDDISGLDHMKTCLISNGASTSMPAVLRKWHIFSRPSEYWAMAHIHALEIVDVLGRRFVTGHGDDGPRGWKEFSTYREDNPL